MTAQLHELHPASHIRKFLKEIQTLAVQFLSLASNLEFLIQGGAEGVADFASESAVRFARRTSRKVSRSDAPPVLSLTKDFLNFLPGFRPATDVSAQIWLLHFR